jgi:hypothetical protein
MEWSRIGSALGAVLFLPLWFFFVLVPLATWSECKSPPGLEKYKNHFSLQNPACASNGNLIFTKFRSYNDGGSAETCLSDGSCIPGSNMNGTVETPNGIAVRCGGSACIGRFIVVQGSNIDEPTVCGDYIVYQDGPGEGNVGICAARLPNGSGRAARMGCLSSLGKQPNCADGKVIYQTGSGGLMYAEIPKDFPNGTGHPIWNSGGMTDGAPIPGQNRIVASTSSGQIVIMNFDGSGQQVVTKDRGYHGAPSVCGNKLYYEYSPDHDVEEHHGLTQICELELGGVTGVTSQPAPSSPGLGIFLAR